MAFKTYYAYCSARDQRVPVVRKSEVLGKRDPDHPYPDGSEVVCLEYGATCTGMICPHFQVPSAEMGDRLIRAGLLRAGAY